MPDAAHLKYYATSCPLPVSHKVYAPLSPPECLGGGLRPPNPPCFSWGGLRPSQAPLQLVCPSHNHPITGTAAQHMTLPHAAHTPWTTQQMIFRWGGGVQQQCVEQWCKSFKLALSRCGVGSTGDSIWPQRTMEWPGCQVLLP